MVGTYHHAGSAYAFDQHMGPVLADVIENADLFVSATNCEEAFTRDFKRRVVANLRKI